MEHSTYPTSQESSVPRPVSHEIVAPRPDIVLASRNTFRTVPPLIGGYKDMVGAIWLSFSAGKRVVPAACLVGIQRPNLFLIPRCRQDVAHRLRPLAAGPFRERPRRSPGEYTVSILPSRSNTTPNPPASPTPGCYEMCSAPPGRPGRPTSSSYVAAAAELGPSGPWARRPLRAEPRPSRLPAPGTSRGCSPPSTRRRPRCRGPRRRSG